MLIQFRVENFLSIKDSVVLSLLASKDNEHSEHLIVNGSNGNVIAIPSFRCYPNPQMLQKYPKCSTV